MISLDLKSKQGTEVLRKLCSTADVFLDTFRPGVMEKLGLGPIDLIEKNPRLIYARLTGYGQTGYYAQKAGHDINYVAMSGVLSTLVKDKQPPIPPLNLLADFGGGGLLCSLGILLALFERSKSGKGQVIDVSMMEGTAYLASWIFKSRKLPIWSGEPGTNFLDGGAAFYGTYKTKDGKFMAVGAIETQFYKDLLKGLDLSQKDFPQFGNTEASKKKFKEIFLTKSQSEWCDIFDKLDACVTPVLDFNSLRKHENSKSFFKDNEDIILPEPAPRLSRTPGLSMGKLPHPKPGQHTKEILQELGYNDSDIKQLLNDGHVAEYIKSNL